MRIVWYIFFVIIFKSAKSFNYEDNETEKEEGDFCTDEEGSVGNCTKIQECDHAKRVLEYGGQPTVCGFDDNDFLVCCSIEGQRKIQAEKKLQRTAKGYAYNACVVYNEMICPRIPARLEERKPIIANGKPARFGQFPYMVLLGLGEHLLKSKWWCGGSIISDRFVLTAAHCTTYGKSAVRFIRVAVQRRSDPIHRKDLHQVLRIYKHPRFNPPQHYNDIALLYTDRKIIFNEFVQPACLYFDEEDEDLHGTIAGWGQTSYRDQVSDQLQYARVTKYSDDECKDKFSPVPRMRRRLEFGFDIETQICYGHRGGYSDTCPGDSGGPLEADNFQFPCLHTIIGVTSFGDKCGLKSQPGAYTRISAFLPWIERLVWQRDNVTLP